MSTTALLTMSLRVTDGDMNDDSTPPVFVVQKTVAGITAYEHKRRVVNNTTVTLWSSTAAGEALGDFDLAVLWVETGSLEVELTCNDGDAAEAIFTVTVTADCPLVLGDDASRYNTGALTGSADVIDLIRAKNGAATDVVVHLWLAT